VNDTVWLGRFFGSRLRTGRYSTAAFAVSAVSVPGLAVLPAESGWPTLQLSR
jgi:hypothetical protein